MSTTNYVKTTCPCGQTISIYVQEGKVICPSCKTHLLTAYVINGGLILSEPDDPPPEDPNHHEHKMSLLVAADSTGDFNVPIRNCYECGMIAICFEKPYVIIPEWSRSRLEDMTKETIKYVSEPPLSVTKPVGGPRRKKVLGRGLKELSGVSSSTVSRGLLALFNQAKNSKR